MTRSSRAHSRPLVLQLEDERQRYYAVLDAWTTETHRRLMQAGGALRLYAYYWPSTETEHGKLAAVREDQQPPPAPGGPMSSGWRLVTPETVPISLTRDGLAKWIKQHADYLPMYPSRPRGGA